MQSILSTQCEAGLCYNLYMFLSPTHLVEKLNINKGESVIDFGAGSGAYVYPALKAVGESGKVIAVDIDSEMLNTISNTVMISGAANSFNILTADLERKILLPDYSADYAILANTFFHIKNKENLLREIKRILSPTGLFLFVEWKIDSKFGPSKDMRIKEEDSKDLLTKTGFKIIENVPAGDYHYGYILKV